MSSASSATRVPPARALRIERVFATLVVVLPTLGLVAAFALGRPTWVDLVAFGVMYLVTGFGITVGYHRLFTHRSFAAPPWLVAAFAVSGSMALQGSVIRWVADHRRHHMHSDKVGDPHSPHAARRAGIGGALEAFAHAHVGWFFAKDKTRASRFARDLLGSRVITWIDRRYLLWVGATLAIPFALGLVLGGSFRAGVSALVWGGLVRIFAVHHVTWSINSVCHVFGARKFVSKDLSSNVWWLALPSLGESWHNAHHAFPTSARHGLGALELDPSWLVIRSLELVGAVSDVKVPTREQAARRLLSAAALVSGEANEASEASEADDEPSDGAASPASGRSGLDRGAEAA